jgi:hypothetical protein
MRYPEAEDYIRAVQQPARSFLLPELRGAVFEVHPVFRIPMPASGNAAVVFKAEVEGADTALRFFIREDASSRERYGALGRHFATRGIDDCVAHPTWVDGAISLNESTWPMVRMTWVDGRTLDTYVGHLASTGDVGALASLAASWRDFVGRLQGAEFAHGDLQHGNVLIDTGSALRLVDFDGSWIAAFQGGPPPHETGHPNYQRTGREWGRWMDTFPGLVIYTALLTLSRRPASWSELHNGENILFCAEDFAPPFRTRTWQTVSGVNDPEIELAVERLKQACTAGWRATDTLEALLSERPRIDVRPERLAPPPAPLYRGVEPPDLALAWWQQPGATAAGGAPAGAAPPQTAQSPAAAAAAAPPAAAAPAAARAPSPAAAAPAAPPAQGPMPPPPPKTVPGTSGADTTPPEGQSFVGSATAGTWFGPGPGAGGPPGGTPVAAAPRRVGPPPAGHRRPAAEVVPLLILIVGLTAIIAGSVVAGAGGDGAVAAVLSALVAAALALPVLLRRRP